VYHGYHNHNKSVWFKIDLYISNFVLRFVSKFETSYGLNTGISYINLTMTKIKLLVVDDAPFVLKALRDTLEAHGYEVHEASNGKEAIVRYSEVNPDVVLMDILMPKMDGISAIRNIVNNDPGAKIIAVTAVGKRGLEVECVEAGASGFILKPFKTKDLLLTIGSLSNYEGN
jgi:two-component system chemotaxis response regulator CheY